MLTEVVLHDLSQGPSNQGKDLGSRARAVAMREKIESALASGDRVVVDFEGVDATQSFVDELIGVMVLSHGPSVLSSVSFRKCSPTAKAIISFVVSDRAHQHNGKSAASAEPLRRVYA